MSFFDEAIAEVAVDETEPEPERPAWLGPPTDVLPTPLLNRVVLVRSEEAILAIDHLQVFPEGLEFTLNLWLRTSTDFRDIPWELTGPGDNVNAPTFLRLGFSFADGAKWTNAPATRPSFDEEPRGPVLFSQGGGGGGRSWSMRQWLWPLPPPGDLTFYVAWPAFGVQEASVIIDATPFAQAAASTEALWP